MFDHRALQENAMNESGVLSSTATSSCTPRTYWLPAECTADRAVTSAGNARHSTTVHATQSAAETCTQRIYWFAAHCG